MLRKLVVAGAVVAVLLAVTVAVGLDSGPANANGIGPVTFTGNISCNLTGTLTFSPSVSYTSTGPYVVTFTGKNNKCVGLGTTSLSQGLPGTTAVVTLKKSTETFTYSIPASAAPGALCTTLESGGALTTPLAPVTINWLGSGGTITPSTANFPAGGSVVPGVIQFINGPTGGSFTGTTDMLLGYNLATVFTACGPNGLGFTSLPTNALGGDNLMVGPAF